jgi:hypothetical protein
VLSGQDLIGISFTGSGKTLVFVLPLIMTALQEELMMPIVPGEGPFGLIICPTQVLAIQTYDVIEEFLVPLREHGYPELRPLLCIGGISMRKLLDVVKKGVHIVVATPGRLKDMLAKKKINLDNCRYDLFFFLYLIFYYHKQASLATAVVDLKLFHVYFFRISVSCLPFNILIIFFIQPKVERTTWIRLLYDLMFVLLLFFFCSP